MRPRKEGSAEPKHLVGVVKTCPRLDCPNPTLGIIWRGSYKQLQYHCYGCWRKFNYGGKLQPWAKQVSPPAAWLRERGPHGVKVPALLRSPRRSVAGPIAGPVAESSAARDDDEVHAAAKSNVAIDAGPSALWDDDTTPELHAATNSNVATDAAEPIWARGSRWGGRSIWSVSTTTKNDTTFGVHAITQTKVAPKAAGQSRKRGRRADVVSEDLGVETESSPIVQEIYSNANVVGEHEGHGSETPSTPTSQSINNLFEDFLGEGGAGTSSTPAWQSIRSPIAHALWEDEVHCTGILSDPALPTVDITPILDNSDNLKGASCSVPAASANATDEHSARPRRRIMKISFLRYSVPTKTCYYEFED